MQKPQSLSDWQPEQYLRFGNERTQPTIDLAKRIELDRPARILDLGCGPGNSTAVLARLWPDAEITGIDTSEAMLEKARQSSTAAQWLNRSASDDLRPLGTFDLIFSNAVLQWLPDVANLIPRLFDILNPGGALAVQVPFTRGLPAYRIIQDRIDRPEWREYYAEPIAFPLYHSYAFYYDVLCGLAGRTAMWQTEYIHIMESHQAIVEWYKGSALRPYLDKLPDASLRERFLAEYTADISATYPRERDGSVLFPFPRIFFLKYKPAAAG